MSDRCNENNMEEVTESRKTVTWDGVTPSTGRGAKQPGGLSALCGLTASDAGGTDAFKKRHWCQVKGPMLECQDFLSKRSYFQAIKHCLLKTNTLSFDTLTKYLRDLPKGSVHLLSCSHRGQGGGTAALPPAAGSWHSCYRNQGLVSVEGRSISSSELLCLLSSSQQAPEINYLLVILCKIIVFT